MIILSLEMMFLLLFFAAKIALQRHKLSFRLKFTVAYSNSIHLLSRSLLLQAHQHL